MSPSDGLYSWVDTHETNRPKPSLQSPYDKICSWTSAGATGALPASIKAEDATDALSDGTVAGAVEYKEVSKSFVAAMEIDALLHTVIRLGSSRTS